MRILITGNLGYIGPVVAAHFRKRWPNAFLAGFDTGFFGGCQLGLTPAPERYLDVQHYGDLRKFPEELLAGFDAIVHLAAISNDPMGKAFEAVTDEINHQVSVRLAKAAKARGVKRFVFASSCSVYGAAGEGARKEGDALNPLTAYARSKVDTEVGLQALAGGGFQATCFRFATACGFSPRLRLDLVLNDFVASSLATGRIVILSDGTPWRPLIDVRDMARALEWGCVRDSSTGGDVLIINAGASTANYQVKELAEAVQAKMPQTVVDISKDAPPDKRSYKVDFSLFAKLAPEHRPLCSLGDSVQGLIDGLKSVGFSDTKFRDSGLIRLNMLRRLQENGTLTSQLYWS